jgi:hypothetical protein
VNLGFVTHLPAGVQIAAAAVGVIALAAGVGWTARAAIRYVTARNGQNWETVLLLGFFAAAASLSAKGIIGFAQNNMKLDGAYPYVFWLSLDGAAGMLLTMMRRRAREGRPVWHIRLAAWLILAASAEFNWEHAPSLPGAHVAFAMMPVIAGFLAEFAVADIRAQQREAARAENGPAPVRRVELARWLHPLESLRVMSLLAADAALAADEATRDVRADAAARALYRLRLTIAGDGGTEPFWHGTFVRLAEMRAQSAFRRAGFAAADVPEDILRRMQVLVRTRDFAKLDYGTADAAKAAVSSLISPEKEPAPVAVPRVSRTAPQPPSRPGVVSIAAHGAKEQAAREWWAREMAAGTDPGEITGPQINEAAGASPNSSFGRTFKNRMLAEMSAAAKEAGSSGGAVTG